MRQKVRGVSTSRVLWLYLSVLVVGGLVGAAGAAEMRYQINLSDVDGLDDLHDVVEETWEQAQLNAGVTYADANLIVWPVGFSCS